MLPICLVQITIVALIFIPMMMLSYTDVLYARAEELVSRTNTLLRLDIKHLLLILHVD